MCFLVTTDREGLSSQYQQHTYTFTHLLTYPSASPRRFVRGVAILRPTSSVPALARWNSRLERYNAFRCTHQRRPLTTPTHPSIYPISTPRCRRWSGSPSAPTGQTRPSSMTRPPSPPPGGMGRLSTWRWFWGAPTTRCRWCSRRYPCARPWHRCRRLETRAGGGWREGRRGGVVIVLVVVLSARLARRSGWAA